MSTAEKRSHGRSPWREAFEAIVSRPTSASESSCEITRNAKGHFQFTVTVRDPDAGEACERAHVLAEQLTLRYPYTNGAPTYYGSDADADDIPF